MTKAQDQMRQVIESGIQGWIAAQFADNHQPVDQLTNYPLTLDTARVFYRSAYSYGAIEEAFLKSVGRVEQLNAIQLQEWATYHWQYAELELVEDFSNLKLEITDDMLERRESIRLQMSEMGYKVAES